MAAQRTLQPPVLAPSSVRLLKVPDVAPPFDGEVLPGDGALTPEFGVWAPRPALPGTPGTVQPHDDAWTGQFARLLTETLAGVRSMQQIAPWMTDRARVHVRRAIPALRCGQRPRVQRVLVSWPGDDVAELSVIVGLGPRTKALAVRMEKTVARPGQPPRWLCTDIETA